MPTIILHIPNEEPIMGEIDQIPSPQDTLITIKNPRKKDGNKLNYLSANQATVLWPTNRINFIEVLDEETQDPKAITE